MRDALARSFLISAVFPSLLAASHQATIRVRLFSTANSVGHCLGEAQLPLIDLERDQSASAFPRNSYDEGSGAAGKIKKLMHTRPFRKGMETQQWHVLHSAGRHNAAATTTTTTAAAAAAAGGTETGTEGSAAVRPPRGGDTERRTWSYSGEGAQKPRRGSGRWPSHGGAKPCLDRRPVRRPSSSSSFITDLASRALRRNPKSSKSPFEVQVGPSS